MRILLISSTIALMSLQALSNDFKALKTIKGHWQGGEYHPDVDAFQGKKHQTMDQLLKHLGSESPNKIVETMGEPDEIQTRNVVLMPGPYISEVPSSEGEEGGFRMIYHWRGKHDYIYFDVDAETQKVVQSGWYNALE
jgi:hypothetical protein